MMQSEEQARFDAVLKKALNVTGPKVTLRPGRNIAVDVDLDTIVKRGRDLR